MVSTGQTEGTDPTADTAAAKTGTTPTCHGSGHGKGRHAGWMILACVLPMLLVAVIFFAGTRVNAGLVGKALPWLIFLLCPLTHILMMRGGHGDHQ